MTSSETAPLGSLAEPALAIRLVLGVSRLGEADLAGWWSSQGLNPAIGFVLAGFRRTSKVVGAELALLSASRRHRQILPRTTAVHLFSPHLPFVGWTSAYLAEQKTSRDSPIIEDLLGWSSPDSARDRLREWCDEVRAPAYDTPTVGSDELDTPVIVAGLLLRLAGRYADETGDLLVPYVDLIA